MRLFIDILTLTLFCLSGCLAMLIFTRLGLMAFNKILAWSNKFMQEKVDSLKVK